MKSGDMLRIIINIVICEVFSQKTEALLAFVIASLASSPTPVSPRLCLTRRS